MTNAQYDRLPHVLREIVALDRSNAPWLAAIRKPIIPIGLAKIVDRRLKHRRALIAEAERLYGPRVAGAGPVMA